MIDKTARDWPASIAADGVTVSHGWKPETGFLPHRWEGYDEALLLYIFGLGSPSHPLSAKNYKGWASTYRWERYYGYDYLYAGSLFTHSRRATKVQQQYAIDNPYRFAGYGRYCCGLTASDGPGPQICEVNGIEREHFDYVVRGVPHGSTKARSRRGLWWPRCHSRRRSCCPNIMED